MKESWWSLAREYLAESEQSERLCLVTRDDPDNQQFLNGKGPGSAMYNAWMQLGLIFAGLSALSFGLYNFFTKLTSEKFDVVLAVVFITGMSFLASVLFALVMYLNGHTFMFSRTAIALPLATGFFTALAEIFYLLAFQKGLTLSIGNPIVVGGTVIVASFLGLLLLNEQLSATQGFGITLVFGGIVLLSI